MTAKQEAIRLLDTIQEDDLVIICRILRKFSEGGTESHPAGDIDFSKFHIPTERGNRADEYVQELRNDDRV